MFASVQNENTIKHSHSRLSINEVNHEKTKKLSKDDMKKKGQKRKKDLKLAGVTFAVQHCAAVNLPEIKSKLQVYLQQVDYVL